MIRAIVAKARVVILDPVLARRHIATIRPPMSAIEADDSEESVLLTIQYQECRVRDRGVEGGCVEDEDLREGGHQQLLVASVLSTLLALPIGNLERRHRMDHAVREALLALRRCHRELDQGVGMRVLVVARITLDRVCDLEAAELVEKGELVAQILEELVRVADVVAGGHDGRLDTLVEGLQALISLARPNFLKCLIDGRRIQSRICSVACLDVGNTKDSL